MKLRIDDPTILAIELRHRQFGYSVYQGNRQLLDWGVRVYPAVGELEATMASKRLIGLLKLFAPNVIVVKKERWDKANINQNMRGVVDAVKQEAFTHAIRILAITEETCGELSTIFAVKRKIRLPPFSLEYSLSSYGTCRQSVTHGNQSIVEP